MKGDEIAPAKLLSPSAALISPRDQPNSAANGLMKTLNMNTVVAPQPSSPRIDATTIHHGLRTFACSLIVSPLESPAINGQARARAQCSCPS
jgi:hypothetical protein